MEESERSEETMTVFQKRLYRREMAVSEGHSLHTTGVEADREAAAGAGEDEVDAKKPEKFGKSVSSYNLGSLSSLSSEAERLFRRKEKKKKARISRGFLDLISLADPLVSSDNRQVRTYAEEGGASILALPATDSGSNHSESPSSGRVRQRRTTVHTPLDLDQPVTTASTALLAAKKKKEKRKTVAMSQDFPPSLFASTTTLNTAPPPQIALTSFDADVKTTSTPIRSSGEVPPMPKGKILLERRARLNVDSLFQMMYTDHTFYRSWLEERKEDVHNLTIGEWKSEGEEVTRNVVYEVTKSLGFTTSNIKVSQKFKQSNFCNPGRVYGVEISTVNTGIAYADSFVLKEHHRLSQEGPDVTHYQVVAEIEFVKSTFLKGRIESETWNGLRASYNILEQMLEKFDASSKLSKDGEGVKRKVRKNPDNKTMVKEVILAPRETDYSEILRMIHSLVMVLILACLVLAVFRIANTLDMMDARLTNIERAFFPKS